MRLLSPVTACWPPGRCRRPTGAPNRPGCPQRATWQFLKAVRAELSDPLTPVLALGSAASAVLGSPVDAVLVGSVLTGNSVLAASQRLRAESRLQRLLALQIPPARKVTSGPDGRRCYTDVNAAQLRPGDVIEVRTHEVVPADARLIEEDDLEVDESSLTGESLPVDKQVDATPGAVLAERRCMLYAGTTVVAGTAVAVVTASVPTPRPGGPPNSVSSDLRRRAADQLSELTNRALPVSIGRRRTGRPAGPVARAGLRASGGQWNRDHAWPRSRKGMPLVATLAQEASARRLTRLRRAGTQSRGRLRRWAASTSCASTRPGRCPKTGCGCRRCIPRRATPATTC